MKLLKTKLGNERISLSLSLSLFIFLLGIISCQEIPDGSQAMDDQGEELFVPNDPEYESKLKHLTLFMGQVFQDPAAKAELFSFSKLEGNQGEISIDLAHLFETGVDPLAKKKSAIVDAFYKARASRVSSGANSSIEDLIAFIKENKIGIVAPYLAENFEESSLNQLTVSWWTEEFENWKSGKDQEWKGGTKARIIDLTKNIDETNDKQEFFVSDDYAKKNPTIVLGAFDLDSESGKANKTSTSQENFAVQNFVNSANCQDLNQNSVVRILMPGFRLTNSIRPWPHPDQLTLYVVLGTNPGGNGQINTLFISREVKRKHAGDWMDSNFSFLINNWVDMQVDMKLLLFNKRPGNSDGVQVTVHVKTNSQGQTEAQYATVGYLSYWQIHFAQTFNKCGTINNPFFDRGFGQRFYLGVNYGIERFGKFEFYLVPQIQL
jgi:hypothetical protein